jgi:hypothetical protein
MLANQAALVTAALDPTARLLQELLIFAVMPVWLLAGFGDWLLHRWQRIEEKVGWREPALHLLMVAEITVGLTAALLLQITAAVLILLLGVAIAHELTVWRDLSFASARRRIPVPEQWVHALQIVIPWMAVGMLAVIHRDQLGSIIHSGSADWSLRLKDIPLPLAQVLAIVVGGALLVGFPFVEELWRGVRASRRAATQATGRAQSIA